MPGDPDTRPDGGRLRRAFGRLRGEDAPETDTHDPQEPDVELPIADAPDRQQVRVCGTVRTVTLRPRGGVPALEADLDDDTGVITLVWLGRRRISGVGPGRVIAVRGRIGIHDGHRVMFNPRYELRP